MILIDQPYVSGFLKDTIRQNRLPVVRTSRAVDLLGENGYNFISESDAVNRFRKPGRKPLLYTNSENSISWIEQNLAFTELPAKVRLFKDKFTFRDLLKSSYPGLYFQKVPFSELATVDPGGIPFPVIIKPSTGFFSLGVHRVDNSTDWPGVIRKIELEAASISKLYPEEVLDTRDFIIEELIPGEEYAIDCYFNDDGDPVVLNIMHHLFSSESDVSDRVYITSGEIVASKLKVVQGFLQEMGGLTGLTNFPAHVEVRIDNAGRVVPIEVNPMRFGGWCTTADLAWYAWDFNAYEYYLEGKEPDWNQLSFRKRGLNYSVVVLDNSTGTEGKYIPGFDYEALGQSFSKPLEVRPVDFRKWPLFGFVFCETGDHNKDELYRILASDLTDFVKTGSA